MAVAIHTSEPSVIVEGDAVLIHELREDDHDFVTLVREADDAVRATHECLGLGARILRSSRTTLDASLVEREFGKLQATFDGRLTQAVEELDQVAERLLSEDDGELRRTLDGHKQELEKLLDETFDPESKRSVLAKFSETFDDLLERQIKLIRQTVDPSDEEGPLGRLRREVLDSVKDETKTLREVMGEIAEKLAARQAAAEVMELTAIKGRPFQELVFELASGFISEFGDLAEYVADTGGLSGKAGDVVVRLNPEHTRGVELPYVIEVNDEKLGMRAALEKLEKAMKNRGSKVGIIVFPSQEKAPTAVPFAYFDHTAIVVVDKEGADPQALRLALMWARWVVLRDLGAVPSDGFDAEEAGALIEQGVRALQRVTAIKGGLTRATNELDGVRRQVTDMSQELEDVLDALTALIQGHWTGVGAGQSRSCPYRLLTQSGADLMTHRMSDRPRVDGGSASSDADAYQ